MCYWKKKHFNININKLIYEHTIGILLIGLNLIQRQQSRLIFWKLSVI